MAFPRCILPKLSTPLNKCRLFGRTR
jgi:hypothetical protein